MCERIKKWTPIIDRKIWNNSAKINVDVYLLHIKKKKRYWIKWENKHSISMINYVQKDDFISRKTSNNTYNKQQFSEKFGAKITAKKVF